METCTAREGQRGKANETSVNDCRMFVNVSAFGKV